MNKKTLTENRLIDMVANLSVSLNAIMARIEKLENIVEASKYQYITKLERIEDK